LRSYYWDEYRHWLSASERVKLAKGLEKIKPARVRRGGRLVPCEPNFKLTPTDKGKLVEALCRRGETVATIVSITGFRRRQVERWTEVERWMAEVDT